LEPDKKPPSPLLYHLGFMVGLADEGLLALARRLYWHLAVLHPTKASTTLPPINKELVRKLNMRKLNLEVFKLLPGCICRCPPCPFDQ
jgi:hypothetical protein